MSSVETLLDSLAEKLSSVPTVEVIERFFDGSYSYGEIIQYQEGPNQVTTERYSRKTEAPGRAHSATMNVKIKDSSGEESYCLLLHHRLKPDTLHCILEFPAGMVDPTDDSTLAAGNREFLEEWGLDITNPDQGVKVVWQDSPGEHFKDPGFSGNTNELITTLIEADFVYDASRIPKIEDLKMDESEIASICSRFVVKAGDLPALVKGCRERGLGVDMQVSLMAGLESEKAFKKSNR
ncbi:MAG: hypothetical protein TREMPRED_002883 [Tremellales sp. Tagirdzhanova-0007]|nr:MAG: hypothetical protein TREMPRED_002883 [Tremellales sp. Tagirdzhanova-0007]